MNRLVRADLKRIVAKPTLYLVVIIMVIIVMALDPSDTAAQQMEFYRTFFNTIGLTFVLIPVYLSVYTDELNSGIMISVIGMGMPRRRVVRSTDSLYCRFYQELYIKSGNNTEAECIPAPFLYVLCYSRNRHHCPVIPCALPYHEFGKRYAGPCSGGSNGSRPSQDSTG